jgi:hypothetical protein
MVLEPIPFEPDSTAPARFLRDEEGRLYIQFFDKQKRAFIIPLSISILPREVADLAKQLGLTDLTPVVSVRFAESPGVMDVNIAKDSVNIAKDTTLAAVQAQLAKLSFDPNSNLYVNASSVANPPNFDVALSTRASEATLQSIRDRLPSSLTNSGNLKIGMMEDAIGLSRDSSVRVNYANDYDLLSIDLSTARTDALIATNVITLAIVSYTSGATFSIKMFNTSKPALNQSILTPGTVLERLEQASIYLTNTAQSGYTLNILVFKRT